MTLKVEVLEIKKEVQEIQEQSFAINEHKKQNKRQFIIILVLIGLLALAVSYIVFFIK